MVCPRTGDIFVTDGYGNSSVHHLRADGSHVRSWGEPGTDAGAGLGRETFRGPPLPRRPLVCSSADGRAVAGQFNCPHNIAILDAPGDSRRRLAVCDRENMRVQIYTMEGELVASWHLHRPVAICAVSHIILAEVCAAV